MSESELTIGHLSCEWQQLLALEKAENTKIDFSPLPEAKDFEHF